MGGKPRVKLNENVAGRDKSVGYGYVGTWSDGTLGWWLPEHLSPYAGVREKPLANKFNAGEPHVLCKITVERLPGFNAHYPKEPTDE